MGLQDIFRFDDLYNIAEELVIQELDYQLTLYGLLDSQNQETVLDMAAFALNLTKPLYRANLLGRIYVGALQEEYEPEIRDAVKQAIEKVLGIHLEP